jgi:hypothetical protein
MPAVRSYTPLSLRSLILGLIGCRDGPGCLFSAIRDMQVVCKREGDDDGSEPIPLA